MYTKGICTLRCMSTCTCCMIDCVGIKFIRNWPILWHQWIMENYQTQPGNAFVLYCIHVHVCPYILASAILFTNS